MIASVIAIIFSAGVAWTDIRKSARIEALEKDVAALQIDRRRLDEERERATSRLNRLEDQIATHERKWQRVEDAAEIHINTPVRARKRSR
jgi:hypothetical protein